MEGICPTSFLPRFPLKPPPRQAGYAESFPYSKINDSLGGLATTLVAKPQFLCNLPVTGEILVPQVPQKPTALADQHQESTA
ncbi:MAG: hypothetical protein GHCLOJNM_04433 [bacterium]|nr:hypothetical protein [bacterium]